MAKDNMLYQNLLVLCSKLRKSGFDKYADNLEQKLAAFKLAETSLYNVIDETGEDLINEAHPKGDVKLFDAKDNHGDVETILSQHEKIVDVVSTDPKKKVNKTASFKTSNAYTINDALQQARGDISASFEDFKTAHSALLKSAREHREFLNIERFRFKGQTLSIGPNITDILNRWTYNLNKIFNQLSNAVEKFKSAEGVAADISDILAFIKLYNNKIESNKKYLNSSSYEMISTQINNLQSTCIESIKIIENFQITTQTISPEDYLNEIKKVKFNVEKQISNLSKYDTEFADIENKLPSNEKDALSYISKIRNDLNKKLNSYINTNEIIKNLLSNKVELLRFNKLKFKELFGFDRAEELEKQYNDVNSRFLSILNNIKKSWFEEGEV